MFKSNISVELKQSTTTDSTISLKPPTNSQLLDPGYEPCNCDLTLNKCDTNCCCDPSCSDYDFKAFNKVCKKQVRSVFDKKVDWWTCNDVYGDPKSNREPDWFPIICINVTKIIKLLF